MTDGEIHVHLDGALDLLPDRRASEIREHLSRCEDCQSRLEVERHTRARASEILGGAATGPATTGAATSDAGASESAAIGDTTGRGSTTGADEAPKMPSFEVIRNRARGHGRPGAGTKETRTSDWSPGKSDGSSRQAWYRGVAWAATVVLSLGLGWYARSGVVEIDGRSRPVLRSTSPSTTAEFETGPAAGEAEAGGADAATSDAGAGDAAGAPQAPPAADGAPARARQQEAPSEAAALARAEEARSGVGEPESAEPATAALLDEGAMPVEGSLAVTGLPVISVAWETGSDEGLPAVNVVQRLPSGDTLSLRYSALDAGEAAGLADRREAELDAAARAPTPEAEAVAEPSQERVTSVTRRHGPWMLEATAPLDPDSVRALLDGLPPR